MNSASSDQQPASHEPQASRAWIARTVASAGAAAAVAMLAVGLLFNQIQLLIPGIQIEYDTNPAFRSWPGWTETYMKVHPLWFGFVFAAGFAVVTKLRPATGWLAAAARGTAYGALLFVVGSLPILMLIYASFQVSPTLVAVSWAGRNLAQYLVAGLCVGLLTHWQRR